MKPGIFLGRGGILLIVPQFLKHMKTNLRKKGKESKKMNREHLAPVDVQKHLFFTSKLTGVRRKQQLHQSRAGQDGRGG